MKVLWGSSKSLDADFPKTVFPLLLPFPLGRWLLSSAFLLPITAASSASLLLPPPVEHDDRFSAFQYREKCNP